VKKRIILGLLFDGTHFYLSRNFRLQKLGDLNWLQGNFQIFDLTSYVDEIAIFHIQRRMSSADFGVALRELTRRIFVPVSVGGGLRDMREVDGMFRSGADRIMFSNSIWGQPELIRATSEKYGAQATVGVINFMADESGLTAVRRVRDGSVEMADIDKAVSCAQNLGLGEVVLQSVDKDGTGQGFPLLESRKVWGSSNIPVIAAGGFGSTAHIAECLADDHVEAVLTANLLAFLGDGLARARAQAVGIGTDMARWNSLKTFS